MSKKLKRLLMDCDSDDEEDSRRQLASNVFEEMASTNRIINAPYFPTTSEAPKSRTKAPWLPDWDDEDVQFSARTQSEETSHAKSTAEDSDDRKYKYEKNASSSMKNLDHIFDSSVVSPCNTFSTLFPARDCIPSRSLQPILLKASHSSESDSLPSSSNRSRYIPAAAARYLIEHQVYGVRWMYEKYLSRKGGILGDDMGLGKTIQVICLLLAVYNKNGDLSDKDNMRKVKKQLMNGEKTEKITPSLIVAPACLVENWIKEIREWGYFNMVVKSDGITQILESLDLGHIEIVLISYEFLVKYVQDLKRIEFDLIIYDEGHRMTNPKTRDYASAMELSHANCRLILSGTPIQNKIEEIGSLLTIVTHGNFLGRKDFKTYFVEPIKRSSKRSACETAILLGMKRNKELDSLMEKYILRRLKDNELKLKGKDSIIIFCELSDLQAALYKYILALPDFDNARYHSTACPCGSKITRSDCCLKYQIPYSRSSTGKCDIDPRAVVWHEMHPDGESCIRCPTCVCLPCISILLKVASHPCLLQAESDSDIDASAFLRKALTPELVSQIGGERFKPDILSNWRHSGKMVVLGNMLTDFQNKDLKTLIFTYNLKTLDLIEGFLKRQGWEYSRLDGRTKDRVHFCDAFNGSRTNLICLISTKAGGTGLNLQSASNVIIFDSHWNPSIDSQAQDRAYRYGQKSKVIVYRLISRGTVEEMIYMRQLYKQQLQRAVLGATERKFDDASDGDAFEKRGNFEGIEGDKASRGELFGMENILQYHEGSILQRLREQYKIEDDISSDNREEEANEVEVDDYDDDDEKEGEKERAEVQYKLNCQEAPPKKRTINSDRAEHPQKKCSKVRRSSKDVKEGDTILDNRARNTPNLKMTLYRPSYLFSK